MDIEQKYGIIAERSVCVVGLTKTDTDDGIVTYLQTYGTVAKIVRVQTTDQ